MFLRRPLRPPHDGIAHIAVANEEADIGSDSLFLQGLYLHRPIGQTYAVIAHEYGADALGLIVEIAAEFRA